MEKQFLFNKFMKAMMFVVLIGMTVVTVNAQEIKVRSINHLTTDITARSAVRMDDNNKECAIVRVNIPSLKTMDFGNSVVGGVEYNAGEYILYVPEGTIQISLSVDGYKDSKIDFSQYDISVEGKNVYRVTLYIDNGEQSSNEKHGGVAITTEPISAFVLMDGMPLGQTPLTLKDVSVGEHILSFPNTDGYTLPDQTITIKENATFEKHYVLTEKDMINPNEYVQKCTTGSEGEDFLVKNKIINIDGKKGLQDFWGNWVIPCKFDYIYPLSLNNGTDKVFRVGNYDKEREEIYMGDTIKHLLVGLYKPNKGLLVPIKYNNISLYDWLDGYRVVKLDRYLGVIDRKGKEVVPCHFDNICIDWDDDAMLVAVPNQMNQYSIISKDAKYSILPDFRFNNITPFVDGIAIANIYVNDEYHTYAIKKVNPKLYLPERLNNTYDIRDGTQGLWCGVKPYGGYGVYNTSFKELTSFNYEDMCFCEKGWIKLASGSNKRGYVKYNDYEYYYSGMRMTIGDNQAVQEWVVVDKNGHIYQGNDENDGIACLIGAFLCIKKNDSFGLYDNKGNIVLPFDYERIAEINGYIVAYKDDQATIFDESLNELLTFEVTEYIDVKRIENDIVVLFDEATVRYGFMNLKGEVLAGCLFDFKIIDNAYKVDDSFELLICHGLALLYIGDRCGLIDKDGNVVAPLIYSLIIPFQDETAYAMKPDGTWIDLKLENYNK